MHFCALVQFCADSYIFTQTHTFLCRLAHFCTNSRIFMQTCSCLLSCIEQTTRNFQTTGKQTAKFIDHQLQTSKIYRLPPKPAVIPAKYNQVPVIQKPTLLEPLMTEQETSVYPKIRREMRLLCRMYYTVCHLFHILDNDGKTRWLEKSSLIIITTPGISSELKHYE